MCGLSFGGRVFSVVRLASVTENSCITNYARGAE